ncbi:MarR family winged helix-turn-helix transcriptional regulator [Virgibacillus salexigens]|uniref:MarR family winged helix-turn-helix transcriptional regulator n=1 Tax=Virgibacillus massiliensis TaxID=1462526 RepID=UPI00136DFE5E|nr:MarR family transcriptional regulator [Virgibacillus massiliensis]MYL42665.1 MarR family transcriptional regulator [Virgibacillus massiliensis]
MSSNHFSSAELTSTQIELIHELRLNSGRAVMFHELLSDKLGLNATDHKCLDFLNRSGPVTAGQLAQLTGLTTGSITSVIDRLEASGYVGRDKDPKDRRRVIIKVVPEEMEKISPMFQSIFESTVKILSQYNERETKLIHDFIKQCNEMTLTVMNQFNQGENESRKC